MARSCAVVLLLGALVLGVRGDEGTTDSNASNVGANRATTQPRPSYPVVMFLVTTNNTQGHPANGTVVETAQDVVQENISDPAGPSEVVLITVLKITENNGTENSSNSTAELRNSLKGIDEDTHNRLKSLVDREAPLVRKKRTFFKKMSGGSCNSCSPQPPPPQPTVNRCGMTHNPCPSPCGMMGGGCNGGGGTWYGHMGRKKK